MNRIEPENLCESSIRFDFRTKSNTIEQCHFHFQSNAIQRRPFLPLVTTFCISKMFQVLLQYFEDRFASFYVEEPLSNYNELLDRVKKAIPVLQTVDNEQIVVSYKDVSLETFITDIDRNESLHVLEAFRNASLSSLRIRHLPTCPFKGKGD